jgi:hypothetical protein
MSLTNFLKNRFLSVCYRLVITFYTYPAHTSITSTGLIFRIGLGRFGGPGRFIFRDSQARVRRLAGCFVVHDGRSLSLGLRRGAGLPGLVFQRGQCSLNASDQKPVAAHS